MDCNIFLLQILGPLKFNILEDKGKHVLSKAFKTVKNVALGERF